MTSKRLLLLLVSVLGALIASPSTLAATMLAVGAAKVNITPSAADMVAPFKAVADDIFVRAVVLDQGGKRAVLVVVDVPTMQDKVAAEIRRQIADEAHVPAANILLATSHTHNAVRVDPNVVGVSLPGSPKWVTQVTASTLDAVRRAMKVMLPARVGIGTGKSYLVVNRNQWSESQHRYVDGVDRAGNEPIDLRLGVVKFEGEDGKPIAFLLNYAIEPVIAMAMEGQISGDVPGATARYIEDRAGSNAVALFTIGAAGSPLYRVRRDGGGTSGATSYIQADPRKLISAMATILGEEALAVAADMRTSSSNIEIAGASRTLECPGKVTKPLNLPNQCAHSADSTLPQCLFKDSDAPPVTLGMGLLRIGDLALVEANANVTPVLGKKLVSASPLANTWIVALAYGPMHYVVDDAAYPLNTYEATASTAKQGCAERGFIDGALGMIHDTH